MSELSDGELVEAAMAGDGAALGDSLARHRPLLLTLCRRALDDPWLAEDAAQEACAEAILSLDRLRDPARFGPWLGGIGLNVCRRWWRYRPREAWSLDALLGGRLIDPASAGDDPADAAEGGELRRTVLRAVAGLPRGQRAAVALVYLDGLGQTEAAAELGIGRGALKARLHKGRAGLRVALGDLRDGERKGHTVETEPNGGWIEVRLVDVRRTAVREDGIRHHLLLLEEVGGGRPLPIWVGAHEATAAALHLVGAELPRPMTYAFAAGLLRAGGAAVREVRIRALEAEVFLATAVVQGADGTAEVDARPSDAVNLALAVGAPIRAAQSVLEAAAVDAEDWPRLAEMDSASIIAEEALAG